MGRLEGKVALVTGAGQGLGAQIARRFHAEGATVVVAEELAGTAIALDVTDSAAIATAFATIGTRFGRLDVLVDNAGISGLEGRPEEAERQANLFLAHVGEQIAGGPITTHLDITLGTTDDDWHCVLACTSTVRSSARARR